MSDPGSAMTSWSANQWGEQWELQGSGIVMGELTGSSGMCIPASVEKKAAVRSDRRYYSLNISAEKGHN